MQAGNSKKISRSGPRTVYLPDFMVQALPEGQRSTAIAGLAAEASHEGYALSLVPSRQPRSIKVRISEALAKQLDLLREHTAFAEESDGSLLARLAYTAWMKSGRGKPAAAANDETAEPGVPADAALPSLGDSRDYYPAQRQFISRTLTACHASHIIGLESATGTGKGLVLAASAYTLAQQGEVVAIASPSHRISAQTRLELERLMAHNPAVGVATVRGRQEFVSDERLREYIDYDDKLSGADRSALEDWISQQDDEDEQCWLMETLPDTETPLDLAALQLQPDDEGCIADAAYRRQFARAGESGIVLCTHSMLCHDFVRRLGATSEDKQKLTPGLRGIAREEALLADARARFNEPDNDVGLLPRYTVLFVDEAHQLEPQFSNAQTQVVSIASLVNQLRIARDNGVKGLVRSTEDAQKMLAHLRAVGQQTPMERLDLKHAEELRSLTARLVDTASKAAAAARKQAKRNAGLAPVASRLTRSAHTLRLAVRPDTHHLSWMSFSPVRFYPRIETGPGSVASLLSRLWARVGVLSGGAALSATLYLPRQNGVPTADPMLLYRMAIPRSLLEPEPFPGGHRHVPKWVFEPVTLHRIAVAVGSSARHPLCPPKDSQDERVMSGWAQALAPELIERTLSAARGGTLVLNTSYLSVQVLARALLETDASLERRLIVADQATPFEFQRRRYMELAESGHGPVWLATGRAWTGLDLSMPQRPPLQDLALTDLVITRLPFNLNRTLTQRVRVAEPGGWKLSEQEMLFALRQGAGRLVRRQGLHDRHLWLYDPRAFDASRRYYAGIAALFNEYRNRQAMR